VLVDKLKAASVITIGSLCRADIGFLVRLLALMTFIPAFLTLLEDTFFVVDDSHLPLDLPS